MEKGGFPAPLRRAAKWLLGGTLPDDIVPAISRIESIRAALRARGEQQFKIYYSPMPVLEEIVPGTRTPPGEIKTFTARQLAMSTSVNRVKGAFLHLCAKDCEARRILELGACAGISGGYLASIATCDEFITIEASEDLVALARSSLASAGVRNATVINGLFDDVLDVCLPTLENRGVDLAWIDGQHESVATLRFMSRILPVMNPQGIMLFDDIYWSEDMLRAWKKIEACSDFSDTVNFGICGAAVVAKAGNVAHRQWDLTTLVANREWQPRKPHGWS